MSRYPREWQTTTLAEICNPDSGLQTGPFGSQLHASDYSEQGVPVVMPKDIINYRVSIEDIARIPEAMADELSRHRLWIGDIVFARRGDIGRCALITSDEAGWICGTGCLRARLYTESVLPDYLIYYLDMEETKSWLEANAVGQTMLNLNTGILAELPVLLPPLTEQRQIAAILSTWDEAITLTEQLIDALQRRKQALMQLLLTGAVRFPDFDGAWEDVELGTLGNCIRGVNYKPETDLRTTDSTDTVRLLRANNIANDEVNLDDLVFVMNQRCRDNQILKTGDIVICMASGSRALVGKTALFSINDNFTYTVGAFCSIFRAISNFDTDFISHLLQSEIYKRLLNTLSAGSSINNLKPSDIEGLVFEIPRDLSEREEIAEALNLAREEIAYLTELKESVMKQKRGLMQQLLTGAVRVQVEE